MLVVSTWVRSACGGDMHDRDGQCCKEYPVGVEVLELSRAVAPPSQAYRLREAAISARTAAA